MSKDKAREERLIFIGLFTVAAILLAPLLLLAYKEEKQRYEQEQRIQEELTIYRNYVEKNK